MNVRKLFEFSSLIDHFQPADGPPPDRLWPFIRWCLKGSWGVMGVTFGLSLLVGFFEIAGYWLFGWVIDYAMGYGQDGLFSDNIWLFAGIAAFFIVIRPLTMGLNAALNTLGVMNNANPLILSRLHRHTIGQALSFFDDDFAGRIAQKQQQTARALSDILHESLNAGGFFIAAIVGAIVMVGAVSPMLALMITIWAIALSLVLTYFLPRIQVRSKARAAARAMVTGQVVDTITNISTVKLFAHGHHEDQAALGAMSKLREKGLHFSRMTTFFRLTLSIVSGFLPVMLLGGALWLWSHGTATPGDVAAASMVAMRLSQMSNWVSFTLLGIFGNIGEVEDGMRTLAHDHRIVDREGAVVPSHSRGALTFEGLTFGYGQPITALNGFDLKIRPGEKIGLVGRSGAGKSTVVALLLRLYEVEKGRILLDGDDIRDLTQDGLRHQIAMVTQDAAMFNRSAMENIRYGNPDASDEAVYSAARQAQAHEFIKGIKDYRGRSGYNAHLGERGVKLSGGQRQRIALARAIIKDAPVLVLDEATSALDSEVEAAIQETLYEIMEGKTVIAIAHRLSTIARMDRIIVMDAGRIAEDGSHDALLSKGGLYAEFWGRQSGGFLGLAAE